MKIDSLKDLFYKICDLHGLHVDTIGNQLRGWFGQDYLIVYYSSPGNNPFLQYAKDCVTFYGKTNFINFEQVNYIDKEYISKILDTISSIIKIYKENQLIIKLDRAKSDF